MLVFFFFSSRAYLFLLNHVPPFLLFHPFPLCKYNGIFLSFGIYTHTHTKFLIAITPILILDLGSIMCSLFFRHTFMVGTFHNAQHLPRRYLICRPTLEIQESLLSDLPVFRMNHFDSRISHYHIAFMKGIKSNTMDAWVSYDNQLSDYGCHQWWVESAISLLGNINVCFICNKSSSWYHESET